MGGLCLIVAAFETFGLVAAATVRSHLYNAMFLLIGFGYGQRRLKLIKIYMYLAFASAAIIFITIVLRIVFHFVMKESVAICTSSTLADPRLLQRYHIRLPARKRLRIHQQPACSNSRHSEHARGLRVPVSLAFSLSGYTLTTSIDGSAISHMSCQLK